MDKDKLLKQMRDRFKRVCNADTDNRENAIDDLKFALGGDDQWDDDAREARKGRPILTVNKLPKFIRQVTGDQRQNRPSIKVRPVDSQADPMIAKILEGHIRNIEYNSNAAMAYDIAFKQACAGGYPGFWRVNTEYTEDDSFDQDIVIDPVHNQFTVYCDPDSIQDVYRGRLDWCFVTETMDPEEYRKRFKSEGQEWDQGTGEAFEGWYLDGQVRIAEYWVRQPVKKTLYLLATGETVDANEVKDFVQEGPEGKILVTPDGVIPIVRERRADSHKIMWYLVSGNEILEGPKEWAGKFIPIIPVFGDTWVIEGKTHYKSLIRDAKDSQRMYNYMLSQNVEMAALAPKTPFKVTPKQIEGHERQWNNLNTTPFPYVLFNPDPMHPGSPQREPGAQINAAYTQLALTATDDMKDCTGIYDASLGARSNEQSGKAILARQREGDVGTFEFIDNLTRAIQFTGKILVDLIPRIYDTERTIRVLGPDDGAQLVPINKQIQGPSGETVIINDTTVGKYDVHVTSGPSYTTQRMENAEAMQSMIQAAPAVAPIVLPRWVKMMDWPEAQEIAEEIQGAMQPQQPQSPPISASVAIDLAALRPDVADMLIAKVIESGQIKANFKEQPTPPGEMVGGQPLPNEMV